MTVTVRDGADADTAAVVALNAAEVQWTSPMDAARLDALRALGGLYRVAVVDGRVAGFVLGMFRDAPYENDNFAWFRARYDDFYYVDRIVVDGTHTGRGIGSALYRDLFAALERRGVGAVVCEYVLEPDNAASRAFHERLGFSEAGRLTHAAGGKRVAMLHRRVDRGTDGRG